MRTPPSTPTKSSMKSPLHSPRTPNKNSTRKLMGMLKASGPSAALIEVRTPTKNTRYIKSTQNPQSPIASQNVYQHADGLVTTHTPRKRVLRNRVVTYFLRGSKQKKTQFSLLTPASNQTPPRVLLQKKKAGYSAKMPIHDTSAMVQNLCISYQSLVRHPHGRQKPDAKQLFLNQSAKEFLVRHGVCEESMNGASWNYCHIVANSLGYDTQKPNNFVIGTSQANAHMLLLESLIPALLKKMHEKEGLSSNPKIYLDITPIWLSGFEDLRVAEKLIYTIKAENKPADETISVTKEFDMLSQEGIPKEALEETEKLLLDLFLEEPEESIYYKANLLNHFSPMRVHQPRSLLADLESINDTKLLSEPPQLSATPTLK